MTNQILRTVLAGILAGLALFMLPFFLLKVVIFFAILWAIGRLLWGGHRKWRHWNYGMHPAFAYKFQNMTEEEKKAWVEKFNHNNCCGWDGRNRWEEAGTTDVKSTETENPVK